MKQITLLLALVLSTFTYNAFAQGVAISSDTLGPDSSAILELRSTDKGFLAPRMTQAQRNAISSPATGLLVYQTDSDVGFYYYTSSSWNPLSTSSTFTLNSDTAYNNNARYFVVGNNSPYDNPSTRADSTRMYFDTKTGAFRVGSPGEDYGGNVNDGWNSIDGEYSIAMGRGADAEQDHSIAIGKEATANTEESIAIGSKASTGILYSTAIGYNVQSNSIGEVALGIYNKGYNFTNAHIYDSSQLILSIGNGTGSLSGDRSNALEIYKSGKTYFYNTPYVVDGTDTISLIPQQSSTPTSIFTQNGNTVYKDSIKYFIIGKDQIDFVWAGSSDDTKMYFNQETGAFRAGTASGSSWDSSMSGTNSLAAGKYTGAEGENATAFGYSTAASGNNSTALNSTTTASGRNSTAMGLETEAASFNETAIGMYNSVNPYANDTARIANDYLFTIGNGTSTFDKSNAIVVRKNGNTEIYGELSLRGSDTITFPTSDGNDGQVLTTDGNGNIDWETPSSTGVFKLKLNLGVDANYHLGTPTSPTTYKDFVFGGDSVGNNTSNAYDNERMVFRKQRGAFRAGLGTFAWNDTLIGYYSFSGGNNNQAAGESSTAFGEHTKANGVHSTALGYKTEALGQKAFAAGYYSVVTGNNSFALGYKDTISGKKSYAMGDKNNVKGHRSYAYGRKNHVEGDSSFVFGNKNTENGTNTYSFGNDNQNEGTGTFALGNNNYLDDDNSFAFGTNNRVTGDKSFAFGDKDTITWHNSVAFGSQNKVTGQFSYAHGLRNKTSGYSNTTFGTQNSSTGDYNFLLGRQNTTTGDYGSIQGEDNTIEKHQKITYHQSYPSGGYYDTTDIEAQYSYLFGKQNTNKGEYNFSYGNSNSTKMHSISLGDTNSTMENSTSIGSRNTSSNSSTSIGHHNTSSNHSISIGDHNDTKKHSFAFGAFNDINANNSISLGDHNETRLNANYSYLFGKDNISFDEYSFSLGQSNINNGHTSYSIGKSDSIYSDTALAIGFNNKIQSNSEYSFILGTGNIMNAENSYIIGSKNEVTEENSYIVGDNNEILGKHSLVFGGNNFVREDSTVIIGYRSESNCNYNPYSGSWSCYDVIFKIGNGDATHLSNAMEVFKSGRTHINGELHSENFLPLKDTSYSIGSSTKRWNAVYAKNGTIQTSDIRLKTNIKPLSYGLNEVLKMKTISYNWKSNPKGQDKIGLVAQNVLNLIPEVVNVGEDAKKTLGVNYAEIVPVLVNAIKELEAKNQALTAQNNSLQSNIDSTQANLQAQLNELKSLLDVASK